MFLFTDLVTWLVSTLKKGPLSPLTPSPAADRGSPIGVRLHFLDIYLAELTKCGHDSLSIEQVNFFNYFLLLIILKLYYTCKVVIRC